MNNLVTPAMIIQSEHIHVNGIVQGVGFRPTVWHLAQRYNLHGHVKNAGDGVQIFVQGLEHAIDLFVESLHLEQPLLARIDTITRQKQVSKPVLTANFNIIDSSPSTVSTAVSPDAATCQQCLDELFDEHNHRHHYPFTNCTHCGPRLSIIQAIPYDRAQTSMAKFTMCPQCQQEYQSVDNRRFHAQPNACSFCGPQAWLTDNNGRLVSTSTAIKDSSRLIKEQAIVAIKGIGGFHLAVNAANQTAVSQLRQRKQRPAKPFALMAKNIEMINKYCHVSEQEKLLLTSSAAPVVLLRKRGDCQLADAVAPGQKHLGFLLPYSPLHHLLFASLSQPIVLTSGNKVDEPQCIDNIDALDKLGSITDYFLLHNRDIVNRVDDSVIRIMADKPQLLRRARGYAPYQFQLPAGFESAPAILAMGGELKNTFCLLQNGKATLSQHIGDLENYSSYVDYQHHISLYQSLFQFKAEHIAIDMHPEYLSTKYGHELAGKHALTTENCQHHHAHIAACLADNGYPIDSTAVLGIALDGLGYGDDHTLWGGEFLVADYENSQRIGQLKAIPLFGGNYAMLQPWRNCYAHLNDCLDWQWVMKNYPGLPLVKQLENKPLATLDAMLENKVNCPPASSAGRLFDAVAAAVDINFELLQYEGQAAIGLENQITTEAWQQAQQSAYKFSLDDNIIDPSPMWKALLADLSQQTTTALISARFHKGLAIAIEQLATRLAKQHKITTIALSGGVFQNKTLFEAVKAALEQQGFTVLCHQQLPANDGGLALGQAVIAATRTMRKSPCA